jgi:hypothetical protein
MSESSGEGGADAPASRPTGYPPELFLDALTPYTETYETIQSVLLWRRPIAFAVFYLSIQLLFLFVYYTKLSSLSVVALVVGLAHIAFFVWKGLCDDLGPVCFPPIDASRIYPLEPFCQGLSRAANWIASTIRRVMQSRKE